MAINLNHQQDQISSTSGIITQATTGGFIVANGDNITQKPIASSALNGLIRYNTTNGKLEGVINGSYFNLVTAADGLLLASNNLSDLQSLSQARTNLGVLAITNNLSDVASATSSRQNLGLFYSVNAPSISSSSITLTNPLSNIQEIQFSSTSLKLILPAMNASNSILPGWFLIVTNLGSNAFSVVAQDTTTTIVSSLTQNQTVLIMLLTNGTANGTFQVVTLASGSGGTFLQASNNLSDVATPATALNNILPSQTSQSGKFLTTNGSGTVTWGSVAGSGTITSLGLSSGTTGLIITSSSSNPITTSGTFTLSGTLAVANGGTGSTTGAGAATNLGVLLIANNLSDLNNASTARTNLGLGPLATATGVNNSNWSGTDLSISNGGTNASTSQGALTNLGWGVNAPVASGSNITLVNPMAPVQNIQFSTTGKALILPVMNASNSIPLGWPIIINNVGSNTFAVQNSSATPIYAALSPGSSLMLYLTSASTTSGTFTVIPLLIASNNLSDVASTTTALTNLGAAPIASPALTGVPTAPTASPGTSTTQLATTAFISAALSALTLFKTIKIQTFSASGTYHPGTGMSYCIGMLVGAGGGGGSATDTWNAANGGGSGAFSMGVFSSATIGSSQVVTIGSGGAGGSAGGNNTGGSGTSSSFGALLTAGGGGGGGPIKQSTNGSPGTAGTGTIATSGSPGQYGGGAAGWGNGFTGPGGNGGSSFFGGGGLGGGNGGGPGTGANGINGGGGGGSGPQSSQGGNGGSGYLVMLEFCNQ